MTTKQQPGSHLDADQLNAFAEGTSSAQERALCLQHLAECSHCRDVVFLAGTALSSDESAAPPVRRFAFFRWPTISLSGAVLASVVIVAVFMHRTHPAPRPQPVQVAEEPSVSPPSAPAPTNRIQATKPKSPGAPERAPATQSSPRRALSGVREDQKTAGLAAANRTVGPEQATAAPMARASEAQAANGAVAGATNNGAITAVVPPRPNEAATDQAAKAAPSYSLSQSAAPVPRLHSLDASAQVSGVVTDASGAVVPRAKVTLDQTSGSEHGNTHWETVTDKAGRFSVVSLPPGKYRMEISSPGFLTQVREVDLGRNQLAQLDSRLALGSMTQSVTVQAAAPVLNTESASLSSTVEKTRSVETSVSSGARVLAIDASGRLLLSKKGGKHWKAVQGPWKKAKVTGLSITAEQLFKVMTAEGSWLSSDGEHWRPTNQQ